MQASVTLSQPCHPLLKGLRGFGRSAIGIALAAGIISTGLSGHLSLTRSSGLAAVASTLSSSSVGQIDPMQSAQTRLVLGSQSVGQPDETRSLTAQAPNQSPRQPLVDGQHLYGQSPEADTIGSAYMVFDVSGSDVVGAFYMPHSSFDCFHGSFQANELALTIRDSYEQEQFAYSVALITQEAIASDGTPQLSTQLEGYHPIDTLSEGDRTILETCRAVSW